MVIPVRNENPVRRAPLVTATLIAVNAVVFAVGPASGLRPPHGTAQQRACAQLHYNQRWGAVPQELLDNEVVPPDPRDPPPADPLHCPASAYRVPGKVPAVSALTSLFVHGGWLHLLGNLLFLLVFGSTVEDRLGRLRYLAFYLGIGMLATYGYALAELRSADAHRTLIGASGAIAGVLGAYLRLHPRARVTSLVPLLLFLPLRFPAWLVLGLWFATQGWWAHSAGDATPGVAYLVHVIGFATGFLCVRPLLRYCPTPAQPAPNPAGGTTPAPSDPPASVR